MNHAKGVKIVILICQLWLFSALGCRQQCGDPCSLAMLLIDASRCCLGNGLGLQRIRGLRANLQPGSGLWLAPLLRAPKGLKDEGECAAALQPFASSSLTINWAYQPRAPCGVVAAVMAQQSTSTSSPSHQEGQKLSPQVAGVVCQMQMHHTKHLATPWSH
jgi:hypothetical protein